MRLRGARFAWAVSIVVLACSSRSGSNGVQPTCVKDSFGCACSNTTLGLSGDVTPTASCPADAIGTPMTCCTDPLSDGTVDNCQCKTWTCYSSSSGCTCGISGPSISNGTFVGTNVPSGATQVDSCSESGPPSPAPAGWTCCNLGNVCNCGPLSGPISHGCKQGTEVATCSNSISCTGGPFDSCDGLKWAPPKPSGGGSGSGSGGTHCTQSGGGCSSSSDCCGASVCNMDPNSSFYLTCE